MITVIIPGIYRQHECDRYKSYRIVVQFIDLYYDYTC